MSRPTAMNRSHRLPAAVALGAAMLTALAFVAGCSSGSADKESRASAGGSSASDLGETPALTSGKAIAPGSASDDGARSAVDVEQRAVIAKGSLELTTKAVDDVRRRARVIVTTANGVVANENADSDDHGRAQSVELVLRVPVNQFDTVLDALARLGRLEHRTQSSEDVTTKVIDVAARVRAQRASVESIQRLYARARTIGEVMSIEAQLARRQAALDSLEQQQKWLADQTSLATITLTISRTAIQHAAPAAHHHSGFVGGLRDGWHALATVGRGLAAAIGAVLPFVGVALLVGVPGWMLLRRRHRPVAGPTSGDRPDESAARA